MRSWDGRWAPGDGPPVGALSEDRRSISVAWEICHDGADWEHDFELSYTRLAP